MTRAELATDGLSYLIHRWYNLGGGKQNFQFGNSKITDSDAPMFLQKSIEWYEYAKREKNNDANALGEPLFLDILHCCPCSGNVRDGQCRMMNQV